MLVAPDHQIEEVGEVGFRQPAVLGVLVVVLMDAHDVEPVVFLRAGLEEFDFAVAEGVVEALIADVAHTVECELRVAFLEEHGFDDDIVGFWGASVVVDETGHLEDVESGEVTFLQDISITILVRWSGYTYTRRIIMIPMNREDRNRHINIRILIVDMIELPAYHQPLHPLQPSRHSHSPIKLLTGITQHLQLTRLLAITVHTQTAHHLIHRLAAGLVVVEEVAS